MHWGRTDKPSVRGLYQEYANCIFTSHDSLTVIDYNPLLSIFFKFKNCQGMDACGGRDGSRRGLVVALTSSKVLQRRKDRFLLRRGATAIGACASDDPDSDSDLFLPSFLPSFFFFFCFFIRFSYLPLAG